MLHPIALPDAAVVQTALVASLHATHAPAFKKEPILHSNDNGTVHPSLAVPSGHLIHYELYNEYPTIQDKAVLKSEHVAIPVLHILHSPLFKKYPDKQGDVDTGDATFAAEAEFTTQVDPYKLWVEKHAVELVKL